MERRLAAIMAADVVGYSSLMGANEEETLVRLKAHRDEVADPAIAKHKGRIVKLIGDGVLAGFASIVDPMHYNCTAKDAAQLPHRGAKSPLAIHLEGECTVGRAWSPCFLKAATTVTTQLRRKTWPR